MKIDNDTVQEFNNSLFNTYYVCQKVIHGQITDCVYKYVHIRKINKTMVLVLHMKGAIISDVGKFHRKLFKLGGSRNDHSFKILNKYFNTPLEWRKWGKLYVYAPTGTSYKIRMSPHQEFRIIF